MADFYDDPRSPLHGLRPTDGDEPSEPSVSPSDEAAESEKWNPSSPRNMLAARATMLVARKYGISKAEMIHRWDKYKDREALQVLQALERGEHEPEGYRQRQPSPRPKPIEIPFSWLERASRGMYF